jgi:hypothetical protein
MVSGNTPFRRIKSKPIAAIRPSTTSGYVSFLPIVLHLWSFSKP